MDAGYYTSAAGMLTDFAVESEVSDNLANMQTPGYQERVPVLASFDALVQRGPAAAEMLSGEVPPTIGRLSTAPEVQRFGLNLAQGTPRYTGNPLNIALIGNGFLRVRAGRQTLLTRNGSLQRGPDGTLQTVSGYTVLGANGAPLRVGAGTLAVGRDGTVSVDGRTVGRLGVARLPTGQPVTDIGGGYFQGPGQTVRAGQGGTGDLAVVQGYLETSNVDLATETTRLLAAQRTYQANARMLQMQDDALGLTVNDLAKPS